MTLKWDVRNFTDAEREAFAWRIHETPDFKLPHLSAWNYQLCKKHRYGWVEEYFESGEDKKRVVDTRPMPGCRECAIIFRRHQRISTAWLYYKKRALLADTMGSGKTTSAGGLLAMMKETGELADPRDGGKGRAIIVPRSPALRQWQYELYRMMPNLDTAVAMGSVAQRAQLYSDPWEVLLIGPQMLVNDVKSGALMVRDQYSLLLTDDIDLMRNSENQAYNAIERIGNLSDRMVVMTGTPLQKQLTELYNQVYNIGGGQLFGSLETFKANHVRRDKVAERHPTSGLVIGMKTVTTYRNMDVLKKKIRPLYMRRTAADLEDVELPTINPTDHFLELYPKQRERYRELQKGVLQMVKEGQIETKHVHMRAKLTYGAQICSGLASLGEDDEPMTSVKMDWVIDKLKAGGDLENEKVVIFAQYKNTIKALHKRMAGWDIGYTTVWGDNKNATERADNVERFWTDPKCRVLIGTQAIEQSLNLQVARHLINVDMIMNPARMNQLAGRIRRDNSAFKHVFVHNLLTVDTQEERYLPLLEREEALANYVWDESSELFNALSPMMMSRLITG